MGPGEVISLLGVCTLGITLAALIFATYSKRLAFKQRKLELEAEFALAKTASGSAQTRQIEERLRVLERIATDKGAALTAEIDALRTREPENVQ